MDSVRNKAPGSKAVLILDALLLAKYGIKQSCEPTRDREVIYVFARKLSSHDLRDIREFAEIITIEFESQLTQ